MHQPSGGTQGQLTEVEIYLKEMLRMRDQLYNIISVHSGKTVEEIFVCYETLKAKYGEEIKKMPLGAIGIYSYSDKLRVGLQQLMAGSRNFRVSTISRKDIMSLTEDAAKVSGIPYVMDAFREEAEKVMAE